MRNFFSTYFRGMAAAWLVLAVSLGAVGIAFWKVRESALWRDRARFADEVQATVDELNLRLNRYQELEEMLRRASEVSDEMTESEWRRIAASIDWQRRYPLLMGIGYADAVGETAPVRFIESRIAGIESPDGADLTKIPEWSEAFATARSTGHSATAQGPDLLPYKKNSTIVIFGPVSQKTKGPAPAPAPTSAPAPAPALRGYVLVSFDPDGLLHVPPHSVANEMLHIQPLESPVVVQDEPDFLKTVTIPALGHQWTMRFSPGGGFVQDSRSALPWLVLLGGIAVSFLLFGIVWAQMRLRLREQLYRTELESRIAERTAELQEANRRLEQAVTHEHELGVLKSNFISMVSHELRNPLCIILSSSQILERYRDRISPEKSAAQFAAIQSAVERITSLTEEVLLFGRFEAGRVALTLARVDLPAFCSVVVDEVLSATHQRCAIALRVEGVFGEAECDQKLLRHILSNVLQNAVKYSPPAALVDFTLRAANQWAVFEIKDRGIGIPASEQPRLFTTFHRAGNAAHLPGTGLGLVIVKRCVDAHSGAIEISSAEGLGTLVTIRLPLTPRVAAATELDVPTEAENRSRPAAKLHT